jgi:hypothetical protein
VNGIGAAHKRRMQHAWHPAYNFYPNKYHQDDDVDHLLVVTYPGEDALHKGHLSHLGH